MKNRKAILAAILLLLAPLAALAVPLTIVKSAYTLTYADGWATSPFLPSNDSMSMVMKDFGGDDGNAVTWTHGQTGVTENTAPIFINALTMAYNQGFERIDSSTKVLGGKTFHTTTWRDTGVDSDSTARVKVYAVQQGSFLFVSWLVYNTPDGDGSVAEVEAALASLTITASGIRRFAWNRQTHQARARIDILGRTWQPNTGHIPKGPFFLKR